MDRHQPHRVEAGEIDGSIGLARRLGLQLGVGAFDQATDVAAVAFFKRRGEPDQLVDIREPAPTAGQRQDELVVAGPRDDPLEQLPEPEPRRELTLGGERGRELGDRGGVVARAAAAARPAGRHTVARAARGGRGEQRQRVGADADQRRGEHAEQRRLVARIDERGEVRRQVLDLLAHPEAAAAGGERRDPGVLERALVGRHVGGGPQQHGDVAGRELAGGDQVADLLGDEPCLGRTRPAAVGQRAEVGRIRRPPSSRCR